MLVLGQSISGVSLAAPSARDLASARNLAEEGQESLDAKEYGKALDLFRRAEALVPAPTVELHIGMALEGLGQLLEAHDLLLTVSTAPGTLSDPPHFRAARTSAGELATAILARTPTLTLKIEGGGGGENVTVMLDGRPLPKALLEAPVKVNPGRHTLRAEARGNEPAERDVMVAERTKSIVFLALHPLEKTPRPEGTLHLAIPAERMSRPALVTLDGKEVTPDASGNLRASSGQHQLRVTDGAETFTTTVDLSPSETREIVVRYVSSETRKPVRSTASVMMWTGFGVGAVGLGVGAIAGLGSLTRVHGIQSRCGGSRCASPAEQGPIDDARTMGTISTVGFVVGAVGIGVGVYGVASRPSRSSNSTASVSFPAAMSSATVSVGVGPRGAFLHGAF